MRCRNPLVVLLSLFVLGAGACSSRPKPTPVEDTPADSTAHDANAEEAPSEAGEPSSGSLDAALADGGAPSDGSSVSPLDAGSQPGISPLEDARVPVDATSTRDVAAPDSVGRGCLPDRMPVQRGGVEGFLGQYAYAEPSQHCGDDPCLVYHADNGIPGSPVDLTRVCEPPSLVPFCTPLVERYNNVYCSCRCDDPRCHCDEDFVCKPIVVYGQHQLQPYCVWKHARWVENPDVLEDDVPDSGLPPPKALDLLVVVDNSAAMAEEQKKLHWLLRQFVAVLAYGNRDGLPTHSSLKPQFAPMESLHLGVISADLGLNGAPAYDGCGELSFNAEERDRASATQHVSKPWGDDALMQTSTTAAYFGIYARVAGASQPVEIVPADPQCAPLSGLGGANVLRPGERFLRFQVGDAPAAAANALGCLVRQGRNGCDRTQPLEAALKALTAPDSGLTFARGSGGHGTALGAPSSSGPNGGFLRDDALLVVLFLSSGEDCSIPDASKGLFDLTSATLGQSNVRCALPANQSLLHDVSRYVEGLRALKSAPYRDRIIVGAIAGMPQDESANVRVRTGRTAIGALLAEEAMQFRMVHNATTNADEPAPVCTNLAGDGSAIPSRRLITVAREFGNNAFVASICEATYADIISAITSRIIARWRAQ